MRRRIFLAGATAFAATPAAARPPMPLHDAPRSLLSSSFVGGDGQELTLEDFRGRIMLLNIWATWCVPCREEMPILDRLQTRLSGDEFHVLPLSIDRAGIEPVRRFYEEFGVQHLGIYLVEEMRATLAFGVSGYRRRSSSIAQGMRSPVSWARPNGTAPNSSRNSSPSSHNGEPEP